MSFWGVELKPDKVVPFVPPPEQARLHISQACLATDGTADTAAVSVKVQDGPALFVCRLSSNGQAFANLDLVLDEYSELVCTGAPVHVTGYLMTEEQGPEMDQEDDDEMDEDFAPGMADHLRSMITMDGGAADSDEEDSEASDSGDEYDDAYGLGANGYQIGSDEDSDDEDDEDDEDESDEDEYRRSSNVVIEEIVDAGLGDVNVTAMTAAQVQDVDEPKPLKAASQPSKKRKADLAGDGPAAAAKLPQSAKAEATPRHKAGPTPANTPATVAKQKKSNKVAAAPDAVPAPADDSKAKKQKVTAATAQATEPSSATNAAEGGEAKLSKSQLKKQRKQARLSGEAPAAATPTTPVQPEAVPADNAPKKGSVQKWENGFQIERLHMGKLDGKLAKPGKKVMVKYRGTLSNGKVFDETKGSRTFGFRLGVGEVIKGWDRGVSGMRVGDKRKLTVPPQMAYGTSGVKGGGIPPNATLNFTVELVDVK